MATVFEKVHDSIQLLNIPEAIIRLLLLLLLLQYPCQQHPFRPQWIDVNSCLDLRLWILQDACETLEKE